MTRHKETKNTMVRHTCHARGCNVPVKKELLMCGRHWRMVPAAIQRQVWRHYRDGQCDDKRPSREWHAAADAAIGAVWAKECEVSAYAAARQSHPDFWKSVDDAAKHIKETWPEWKQKGAVIVEGRGEDDD